ncbi:hypothetical protein L2E82_49266 [Cichorium intybus]|uniref:Uncharacterized protein n=1 Tax=Cichorium intybus TaxID=13427 RepID=A0ACB8YZU8_CICIN|nr:hypothetical protein L2E82_49266 [Cichorium intybus]
MEQPVPVNGDNNGVDGQTGYNQPFVTVCAKKFFVEYENCRWRSNSSLKQIVSGDRKQSTSNLTAHPWVREDGETMEVPGLTNHRRWKRSLHRRLDTTREKYLAGQEGGCLTCRRRRQEDSEKETGYPVAIGSRSAVGIGSRAI